MSIRKEMSINLTNNVLAETSISYHLEHVFDGINLEHVPSLEHFFEGINMYLEILNLETELPTLLKMKIINWHQWFHEEPLKSMEPFYRTKSSL